MVFIQWQVLVASALGWNGPSNEAISGFAPKMALVSTDNTICPGVAPLR